MLRHNLTISPTTSMVTHNQEGTQTAHFSLRSKGYEPPHLVPQLLRFAPEIQTLQLSSFEKSLELESTRPTKR